MDQACRGYAGESTRRVEVTGDLRPAAVLLHPIQLLRRGLTQRGAPWVAVLVGALLACSSLGVGLTMDDHFHAIAVRDQLRAPWDLFSGVKSAQDTRQLVEDGIFAWWSDPTLILAFFRPLSSLSIWLDHTLWPHAPVLMHVHSVLWFVLLLGSLWCVYRELCDARKVATLALLLYAIDDAHVTPVGWLANRNMLIALAPAFLSIVAHHRWRSRGQLHGAWLGALFLGIGLMGGEPAVQVCGYLVAYALFLDRARWSSRLLSLAPYALVIIGWRLLYNHLGYGALNSGVYVDPGREPLRFISELAVRLPVLLLGQYAAPMSDLWEFYPALASWLQPVVLVFALVVLAALYALLRPLLRAEPALQFWAFGSVLAAVPGCSTFPEDRLLGASSLGACALLAHLFFAVWERAYPRLTRWVSRSTGALAFVHLVLAPVLFVARLTSIDALNDVLEDANPSIAQGSEAADKTVVLVNPPAAVIPVYLPWFRAVRGQPMPARFRWLATGESEVRLERMDAFTLKVTPAAGFLHDTSQRMFRRAERTLKVGEHVDLPGAHFEITRDNAKGFPAEVVVRFDEPLQSDSFQWLRWSKREFVPFELPAIGHAVTLPAIDVLTLF